MTQRHTTNPRFSTAYRKSSLADRFKLSYVVNEDGCWVWIGSVNTQGYGIIRENRKILLAHRVAYILYNDDPKAFCVCHTCDNRECVNHKHLFLGTRIDNNHDRDIKERKAIGTRHGQYNHGKYINQARWRTRPDGSKYFFSGNPERG